MPRHAATRDAVDVGALRARARVLAPVVVVDLVSVTVKVSVLVAKLLSRGRGNQGGENADGLHI